MKILKKLIIFDAFPKVDAGYQDKSPQGGFITIVVSILLWFLIISEFREYWSLDQKYEFSVDQDIHHQLQINIDITVNTPCNLVTVDVVDVAGERMHVTDKLKVVPTIFDVGSAHHIGDETDDDIRIDIRKMLVDANSNPTFSDSYGNMKDSELNACRVFGYFSVNKVTGNLHITAIGLGYGGYSLQNSGALNFTHRIDEFSFGTFYPRLVNPLDNSIEIAEAHIESFQYFLSVVPTTYIDSNNRILLTSQYAVTDYSKAYEISKGQFGIPGIFFKYDIEPISVRITENNQGFIKFMTRLCGLVGGIWVTIGFIVKISNGIWAFLDQITGGGTNLNGIGHTRGNSEITLGGGGKIGEVNFNMNGSDGGMMNGGISFNGVVQQPYPQPPQHPQLHSHQNQLDVNFHAAGIHSPGHKVATD